MRCTVTKKGAVATMLWTKGIAAAAPRRFLFDRIIFSLARTGLYFVSLFFSADATASKVVQCRCCATIFALVFSTRSLPQWSSRCRGAPCTVAFKAIPPPVIRAIDKICEAFMRYYKARVLIVCFVISKQISFSVDLDVYHYAIQKKCTS